MVTLDRISRIYSENRDTRPKYRRLYNVIAQCVESTAVGPGELIPSERELAEKLGISRVTIRKAFSQLFENGILDRKHGAGTFVSRRIEKSVSSVSSFSEDMAKNRLMPSSKVISVRHLQADAHLALIFGLASDGQVIEIQRVRLANGLAIAYEVVAVPEDVLPDPLSIGQSLYQDMAQVGLRPTSAVQRIRAANANKVQASMLDIHTNAAILHIERHGVIQSGRVVEYTNSYYRSDSYEFVTEVPV
ncbi:MAG: GntR family transcriptional regulator [Gammaproteobacteria bacterium]|nr:GntR family transcriptional regulator [Gammaproteobacteria bacterium]MCY4278155.1 GntR family transcriptional regulator [Gammaproteobacteria bacterium]